MGPLIALIMMAAVASDIKTFCISFFLSFILFSFFPPICMCECEMTLGQFICVDVMIGIMTRQHLAILAVFSHSGAAALHVVTSRLLHVKDKVVSEVGLNMCRIWYEITILLLDSFCMRVQIRILDFLICSSILRENRQKLYSHYTFVLFLHSTWVKWCT